MSDIPRPSKEMMCYAHEIKEVPRYGIPGTVWDKQHCPYCKIERLERELDREQNEHAALQSRCYEGFPSATDGIFDAYRALQSAPEPRECPHTADGKHETHDGGPDCRYCDGTAPPPGLRQIAEQIRNTAQVSEYQADQVLVSRELLGQLTAVLRATATKCEGQS